MKRVVGIDPGLSGAAVMIDADTEALLAFMDIESADGAIEAGKLADALCDWVPELVVIERVHSMPKQGVASSFKFGRAFGCIEGVVQACMMPLDYIAPHVWKAQLKLGKDKASARALASRLWPLERELFVRVKDDNRAEAALLAVAFVRRGRGNTTECDDVQSSATCHNADRVDGSPPCPS